MENNSIIEKIRNQEVFLSIPGEDFVLKSIPNGGYFIKEKGGKEIEAEYSKNPYIMEAIDAGIEISKNEYESY